MEVKPATSALCLTLHNHAMQTWLAAGMLPLPVKSVAVLLMLSSPVKPSESAASVLSCLANVQDLLQGVGWDKVGIRPFETCKPSALSCWCVQESALAFLCTAEAHATGELHCGDDGNRPF
eukprot:1159299-Pelagomonas_calceolata.AAC.4